MVSETVPISAIIAPHYFKYLIKQSVKITAIDTEGIVFSRVDNGCMNKYGVYYFYEGTHLEDWFVELELEEVKPKRIPKR